MERPSTPKPEPAYAVVLVMPGTRKIVVRKIDGRFRLIRLHVTTTRRPAEQIQSFLSLEFDLDVVVLEFFPTGEGTSCCCMVEMLQPHIPNGFVPIELGQVDDADISPEKKAELRAMMEAEASSPLTRLGWIDEAISLVEEKAASLVASKCLVKQYNAGGGFALCRFILSNGAVCWLKATGIPNRHELDVTLLLSRLAGDCLPVLLGDRRDWNAWLTTDEGVPLSSRLTLSDRMNVMQLAVESLARLQEATVGYGSELLSVGAFDQRISQLLLSCDELFEFGQRAMSFQVSTKVARVERDRLSMMREIMKVVLTRVEALDLPATIVHGDLNQGNVIVGSKRLVFLDWAEAYLGSPLISLEHLLLAGKHNGKVREIYSQRYLDSWSDEAVRERLKSGLIFMPLLAAFSSFYGRGTWLRSAQKDDERWQAHVRSLLRVMDRAARMPELQEALCR